MSATQTGAMIEGYQGLNVTQAALAGIVCGVVLVDAQGQIINASAEAEKMLNWKSEQWRRASFELLPAPLLPLVREVFASGQAAAVRLVSLTIPGQESTVCVRAMPLSLAGNEGAVVLVLNDLTAARQLEASLQQLNRLASTGMLAASMVHEIKNALVAGKTFIELLLEKNQEAELAGIVRRELSRIDGIIGRTLKFTAPAPAALAPLRLHEVLEHSLRLVQHQAETQLLTLQHSFQAAPDLVEGDEHELQQAFVNLLLNAVEATGTGGSIVLATERVPGASAGSTTAPARLRVTIRDTGKGIAPEHLGHLFETFFTTKPNGTGLGLAITQRIIREHRGSISVESQLGKGTTFSILLPAL